MKARNIFAPLAALAVAAALLLLASCLTRPAATARSEAERLETMRLLLPGSTEFTPEAVSPDDAPVTAAYRSGTGYVVEVCTDGYAGDIVVWAGVNSAGTVTGLTIRDISETPGLGQEALTSEAFLSQFLNTSGEPARYELLTGATVTSRAIARAAGAASAYVTGAEITSGATQWGGEA